MITVHAGQCGNQLGYCLLDSIYDHLHLPSSGERKPKGSSSSELQPLEDEEYERMNYYFRRSRDRGGSRRWTARSVCVDTEPKVIHDCLGRARNMQKWFLSENNAHYEHGGAGNNWAKGYQLCTGGLRDDCMDSIRRELECSDIASSLLIVHSVGGGTGSGLGTKMTEEICDEFPEVMKFNLAVMPYHFGEVVVQHYNTLLCLSKIAETTDAILLYENETAQEICVNMRGIKSPTLFDVNKAITSEMVPVLLPKLSVPVNDEHSLENVRRSCDVYKRHSLLMQDISHLCPNPNFKFLNVRTTPQTFESSVSYTYDTWSAIVSSLQRMCLSGKSLDKRGKMSTISNAAISTSNNIAPNMSLNNIATSLVFHGPDAERFAPNVKCYNTNCQNAPALVHSAQIQRIAGKSSQSSRSDNTDINFSVPYSSLTGNSLANCMLNYSKLTANGYHRSACLISNGQVILQSLQRPLSKGANMFRAGAYVHQYYSCGLEVDDFINSFRELGSIVNDYANLSP